MKHTITITFETDDNLSSSGLDAIAIVAHDMRCQLESLGDGVADGVDITYVEYENAALTVKNDRDEKIEVILFHPEQPLRGICSCEQCLAYNMEG